MLRSDSPAIGATLDEVTVVEATALAVGVPEALAAWVDDTGEPAIDEILVGWEEPDR